MRNYTFTILINGEFEYLTYPAYSISQAKYLLQLDGYSLSQVVDTDIAWKVRYLFSP